MTTWPNNPYIGVGNGGSEVQWNGIYTNMANSTFMYTNNINAGPNNINAGPLAQIPLRLLGPIHFLCHCGTIGRADQMIGLPGDMKVCRECAQLPWSCCRKGNHPFVDIDAENEFFECCPDDVDVKFCPTCNRTFFTYDSVDHRVLTWTAVGQLWKAQKRGNDQCDLLALQDRYADIVGATIDEAAATVRLLLVDIGNSSTDSTKLIARVNDILEMMSALVKIPAQGSNKHRERRMSNLLAEISMKTDVLRRFI